MFDKEKSELALGRVHEVIKALMDKEKGCPWDREQTPESLTEYMIEECFELVDAIRDNKPAHACDEMGDLLFLVMFIAYKFGQDKSFHLADALNAAADKMIRRHPHVFADASFTSIEELNHSWAEIKKQEKLQKEKTGIFSGLSREMPPLTKAYRIHAKAAQAGFTWENDEEVEKQVEAEWLELLDASLSKDNKAIEHELGDMIFSLVELGRRKGIKASLATDKSALRFLDRFEQMEALAKEQNLVFESLTLDEKDTLWNTVKDKEKNEA